MPAVDFTVWWWSSAVEKAITWATTSNYFLFGLLKKILADPCYERKGGTT